MARAGNEAPRFKARYGILALIAFATMLNYLDRTLLGIAAPTMSKDLHLDPVTLGIVFSMFSWSYAAAQLPGGVVLDRLGVRVTYFLSVTLWSVFTVLQGAVVNIGTLIATRLGLGLAEAPCFPANSRVLVSWFPRAERARATGVFTFGQYAGVGFFSPVLLAITHYFGWRALFWLVGGIGIVFGLVWWKLYREPHDHPNVTAAELAEIEADGGYVKVDRVPFSWRNVGWLLRQRQILGATFGQFATNCTLVFFLTWFPTYLATERGMGWLKVGFFAVLPFAAASVGVLIGGYVSDRLVRTTGSLSFGRKAPIVAGLMLASTIVFAAYLDSDELVIAVLSLAFFGQGLSNLGWALISEVAPPQFVGLTGGVFNFGTQLAGIITPIAVGVIVKETGSFHGALAFIGAIAVLGALSYVLLLGEVRRLEAPANP